MSFRFKTARCGRDGNSNTGSNDRERDDKEEAMSALVPGFGLDSVLDIELETTSKSMLDPIGQLTPLQRFTGVKKL